MDTQTEGHTNMDIQTDIYIDRDIHTLDIQTIGIL